MKRRRSGAWRFTALRVAALAGNTFKEAVRNRAFIGLMFLAGAFLAFSLVLSSLAVTGQGNRVLLDFGFFSISLFGVLIAIVMGAILLHKEIDKKTIFTIIPKPVHRFEVVLGKYFGMLAILIVEVGVLSVLWLGLLWLKGAPVTPEIGKALLLIFLAIVLITAVALMFSSFSRPVLTGILATGVFIVGRVVYLVGEMLTARGGLFVDHPGLRPFGEAVVRVVPDLRVFDGSQEVLLEIPIRGSYLVSATGYCMSYVLVLLALSVLLFQRRDFT